jgi:hypothetical protein
LTDGPRSLDQGFVEPLSTENETPRLTSGRKKFLNLGPGLDEQSAHAQL